MRLSTIARYLIGDRAAILSLGADRSTPLVGAVFVLSAGLARSYHTVDLRDQPWRLLTPFAVSTVLATVLLLTTYIGPWKGPADEKVEKASSFPRRWLSLLGLFWMTAPLAWLYGIPCERFTDPLTATQAKVWTLALVAGWRVVLMTRVLSVLSGRSVVATFFHVMLLADAMVFIGISVAKLPLIQFMGGIRLTESEGFLSGIAFLTTILAIYSFPVWLIGALLALFGPRCWNIAAPGQQSGSKTVWLVAAGSVAAGLLMLFWTLPEQRLATRAESLLHSGSIEQALAMMSARQRSEFPPQWEPPPRVGYGEETPALLDVLEAMTQTPTADWVRQGYLSSFERVYLQSEIFVVDRKAWPRARKLLDVLPEGKALHEKYEERMRSNDKRTGESKESSE
jgi:hypothetical protein